MRKIGIIGGSFDPIHTGHLILADQARSFFDLEQVIFIPARISPFKLETHPTAGDVRYEMVKLAISDNLYFAVSDYEIKDDRISYTVDTMRYLKESLGDNVQMYFITGTDAFLGIQDWKGASELLSNYNFLIGTRPGYRDQLLDETIKEVQNAYGTFVGKLKLPEVDISSTDIKERIQDGKSVKYLLPNPVTGYIMEKGLYGASDVKIRITTLIQDKLKPSRLRHTYGVVQEAISLAKYYGANQEHAELAALFHDAYKEYGNLQHGPAAADAMEQKFHVEDMDVCNAVRYHTTGRKEMSLLEKIIYLADMIEPNRHYPGVDSLRQLAYENLDRACLRAMEHTIEYVKDSGNQLDYRTLEARDWLARTML